MGGTYRRPTVELTVWFRPPSVVSSTGRDGKWASFYSASDPPDHPPPSSTRGGRGERPGQPLRVDNDCRSRVQGHVLRGGGLRRLYRYGRTAAERSRDPDDRPLWSSTPGPHPTGRVPALVREPWVLQTRDSGRHRRETGYWVPHSVGAGLGPRDTDTSSLRSALHSGGCAW